MGESCWKQPDKKRLVKRFLIRMAENIQWNSGWHAPETSRNRSQSCNFCNFSPQHGWKSPNRGKQRSSRIAPPSIRLGPISWVRNRAGENSPGDIRSNHFVYTCMGTRVWDYNTEKGDFSGRSRIHLREHSREHLREPFRGSIVVSYFAFAISVLHWFHELSRARHDRPQQHWGQHWIMSGCALPWKQWCGWSMFRNLGTTPI